MGSGRLRGWSVCRALTPFLCLATAALLALPRLALAEGGPPQTWEFFNEIRKTLASGEYERAIAELNQAIADYSDSEDFLRSAYNHLVFTYFTMRDLESFDQKAREALRRFPDLTASTVEIPMQVNQKYDELRRVMFGSLSIIKPSHCRVFLDGEFQGQTPVSLHHVAVGVHRLELTRSGFRDYSEQVRIEPNSLLTMDVSLHRNRTKTWWITRLAACVGVVGGIALWTHDGDGKESPGPEPLPSPPSPPGD